MNTRKLLKLLQGAVILALGALPLVACSVPHVATPGPEEARAIAEEAYIFAFPMLENYKTMYIQAINTSSPTFRAPFNQLSHATVLLGPEFKDVIRPNNDTLYSFVWLDLRAEPLVISVPEIKNRYYSFQLVDVYTHNFAYIGTRATGTAAGSYLVAGPAWQGDKPAGVAAVFRTEGNFVYSITRTAVNGKEDVPNVLAIQKQYKVQPLSAFLGRSAPTGAPGGDFPAYDKAAAESADFIKYFNFLLGQLAVHPSEQALIAKFGRIGVGPNRTFDAASLGADTRRAIDEGVSSARQKIKDQAPKLGEQKNHWNLPPRIFGNREQMQGQYLIRAAAAYLGLYGNDLEEAYYPSTNWDAAGGPLDASQHSYVLKFAKSEIPAVDAFWSLTMYSLPDGFLVENPIQRYSIGDRTAGLKYGADGSLEIYIQRESPGKDQESNWLPAPNGSFNVVLRMYLPKATALNPLYAPPGIQKREGISFEGSYPTEKTAQTLYDEFDYQAAVQAYVWSTSLVNSMGTWTALQRDLGFKPGELAIAIFDKRMQPQDVVMTANTDVVYSWLQYINISETGPLVIEAPAGVSGGMWDLWQRGLVAIGNAGPDRGQGGKYLVLPRDYTGDVPAGYFPVRLVYSNHAMVVIRTYVTPTGGGLPGAVALAQTIRVYPLTQQSAPEPNRFVLVGDRPFNSDWPKDERYFELLAQALNVDPVPEAGLAILGNLRRLGIEKGKPFNPDERARAILKRAAETGYAMVRAMAFDNRFANKLVYPDRRWEPLLYNTSSQFLTPNYEEVEERAAVWYQAMGAGSTQTMYPAPGTGQFYLVTYRDAKGNYLNASNTYRLVMPANVPVAQFWEVPVYDVETRSLIDTDQKRTSVSSEDDLIKNPDGSVTLYFGPKPPQGMEKNWVKTIPGKGWFTILRLYGPLQPILDKTWKPNDFEKVK